MPRIPPRPLTEALLEELNAALRRIGAPIADEWRPPNSQERIAALEGRLGLVLPAEARLWWTWRDGADDSVDGYLGNMLGHRWTPHPLGRAVEETLRARALSEQMVADQPDYPGVVWSRRWCVFCSNLKSEFLAIACGNAEQDLAAVHLYDPESVEEPSKPRVLSIGELVHVWLQAIEDGTWRIEDGWFAIDDPTDVAKKWERRGPGLSALV
jgi:hypothetical protein